jgi:thiol-disulfide isomerase/thioredoxin
MLTRSVSLLRWLRARIPLLPAFLAIVVALTGAVLVYLAMSGAGAPLEASLHAAQPKQKVAAPEFPDAHDWLNTDKALTMAELRGRFVLLDFWTLCCINCIHIMPDLLRLEERYPGVLVVIGVHSPKFDNEKKTSSIHKAILRYEIKHPVINDADHKLWKGYGVNSWPTFCLIDPEGNIVGFAYGEGQYDLINKTISALLKQYKEDPAKKGILKETPINFRLEAEKNPQTLYFPGKVLTDADSKRIFIADSTNHRIVITDLEGKKIAIAGTGKEGFNKGEVKFSEAMFSDPQGMCLDGDTLYVADRKNHSIRALNLKKETVKLVAGNGTQNRFDRFANKVSGALETALNSPWDLLYFRNRIFIAMAGHHQIWVFDPGNKTVSNYSGNGREEVVDGTLKAAGFAQPSGLATDGKRMFIADSESSSIRSVPLPGTKENVKTVVGVSGQGEHLFNFGDVNGKGTEVRLQHALGVAYHEGLLYVADTYNSKIKVVDPVQRTCATYLAGQKMFDEPGGVAIAGGKMYIADTNNHRIQVVDMKTKELSTLKLQNVEPVRRDWLTGKDKEKPK